MDARPSGNGPFDDPEALREQWLGDWTIAYSTFGMWRNGKRLRPWYTYSRTPDARTLADVTRADDVIDTVDRTARTKPSTFEGTSTQDEKVPWKFRWRGTGWLRLVGMDWRIVYFDQDTGVAATCFTKTFHSEAACNVIVRDPSKHANDFKDDKSIRAAMSAIQAQADFGSMGPLEPATGSKWDPKRR
jgi:hypothetical protein